MLVNKSLFTQEWCYEWKITWARIADVYKVAPMQKRVISRLRRYQQPHRPHTTQQTVLR